MKKTLIINNLVKIAKSTNISFVGYESDELYVQFTNGSVYKYLDSTIEEFEDLIKAESVGSYFNKNFKTKKYEKLDNTLLKHIDDVEDNSQSKLFEAVRNGNLELVKKLVEEFDKQTSVISHCLILAAHNGHLDIVKYLVEERKVDTKIAYEYLFHWTSNNIYFHIVRYFIESGCNPTQNDNVAILTAAMEGDLDMVKYLISKGADPKARNSMALQYAKDQGHQHVVDFLELFERDDKLAVFLRERIISESI